MDLEKKAIDDIKKMYSFNYDLDKNLKILAMNLFEIDKGSNSILQILGEHGPCTEYLIGKIGKDNKKFDLDRDSVRRRILGTPSILSLENEEFIWRAHEQEFKTGNVRKLYNLNLKGITASLSNVQFEKNFSIKKFYNLLNSITSNEYNISDICLQMIKYQIATFMIWYYMNGFNLTFVKDIDGLFRQAILEHILYSHLPNPNIDEKIWLEYVLIAKNFFVLRHVVKEILENLCKDKRSSIYSNELLSGFFKKDKELNSKGKMKGLLEKIIFRDWHLYATMPHEITSKTMPLFEFTQQPVHHQTATWLELEDEMNKTAKKIFDKLHIKNVGNIHADKIP